MLEKVRGHPHFVQCLDVFASGPSGASEVGLVMERCQTVLSKMGVLERPVLVRVSEGILSALGFLHAMSVIHCDLKPANILVNSADSSPRVLVSDLGSAMQVAGDSL